MKKLNSLLLVISILILVLACAPKKLENIQNQAPSKNTENTNPQETIKPVSQMTDEEILSKYPDDIDSAMEELEMSE